MTKSYNRVHRVSEQKTRIIQGIIDVFQIHIRYICIRMTKINYDVLMNDVSLNQEFNDTTNPSRSGLRGWYIYQSVFSRLFPNIDGTTITSIICFIGIQSIVLRWRINNFNLVAFLNWKYVQYYSIDVNFFGS